MPARSAEEMRTHEKHLLKRRTLFCAAQRNHGKEPECTGTDAASVRGVPAEHTRVEERLAVQLFQVCTCGHERCKKRDPYADDAQIGLEVCRQHIAVTTSGMELMGGSSRRLPATRGCVHAGGRARDPSVLRDTRAPSVRKGAQVCEQHLQLSNSGAVCTLWGCCHCCSQT